MASAQLLLLVNYRPEYRHEWGQKTYYTQLRLTSLGKAEAEELLTFLLGSDASLKALKALILEKTEGTPFFMEEVVQTLVEEGGLSGERGHYRLETAPTELQISPTVQGVLAARIDRLTTEDKALLQQLSVIGRQFPLSLIKQVVSQSEAELYRVLSSLQAKEFLYEQPAFPESEYLFKHALTQDVAYGTVLQEQRKMLHERTGHAIEVRYKDTVDDHYSELAHHYSRSDNAEKAITYLHLAGQQAVQRSANTEAISHLTAALELLKTLPDTPERTRHELTLQIALGPVLITIKGWGAPETESAYTRALTLCREVGETSQLFAVLLGLQEVCAVQGKLTTGRELAEQCLSLAQRVQDPTFLLEAYHTLGYTLLHLGELTSAKEHWKQSLALYDPQRHRALAFLYGGDDPGVCCLSHEAWALWFLGYPDQAVQSIREALTLARDELSHPFSLGLALDLAALLYQSRRERQAAQELAEASITLSTDQGFALWLTQASILQGWALAEQGQGEEGIAQMRRGLTAERAAGSEMFRPVFLALLAEVYGQVGQAEEGLSVLAEALAEVDRTKGRLYEAEVYRLKGELLLQQSEHNTPAATASFQQAIDIARQQRAKSLELRATTSLARLWQQQGKLEEARQLLAPVYNWCTEGFDTADLKDAKALLNELA